VIQSKVFGASLKVALALCFFGGIAFLSTDLSIPLFRETLSAWRDPDTQWMQYLCGGIYFGIFAFLRFRPVLAPFWDASNAIYLLMGALGIGALAYVMDYLTASQTAQALLLVDGAALGQVTATYFAGQPPAGNRSSRTRLILFLLLILLLSSVFCNGEKGLRFQYHASARWSGPWNNPNIFGLLMGVGTILSLGLLVQTPKAKGQSRSNVERGARRHSITEFGRFGLAILCLVAAGIMARALLHSYSRGAWVGTVCGLFCLGLQFVNARPHPGPLTRGEGEPLMPGWRVRANAFSLTVIVFSVLVLSFWHFRKTEWHPAHRAFSAVNADDFSWRNRVAAWEGTLQITAEHPWFGAGWNHPEPLYGQYYLPTNLNEGTAIEMNDYLMLGATLGVPALFCFGMYVWLSLKGGVQGPNSKVQSHETEWLKAVCRAGAIVLLVGFWFDGGLFKLATAAPFWILLELGRRDLTADEHG
jgi:O-antigen ligase